MQGLCTGRWHTRCCREEELEVLRADDRAVTGARLEVGHQQVLLAGLAQDLAEHLDGLAPREEEAHGHPRHARHLDVVEHDHQLVNQPLWQVRILPCKRQGVTPPGAALSHVGPIAADMNSKLLRQARARRLAQQRRRQAQDRSIGGPKRTCARPCKTTSSFFCKGSLIVDDHSPKHWGLFRGSRSLAGLCLLFKLTPE